MKIFPKEPDLGSICHRIQNRDMILQPDFQRDLIWNKSKKQSLIDTILRVWQFPPIFVVVNDESILEVLDGQQRLNAIFEFRNDCFSVDGYISPEDSDIVKLDGLKYSQLPYNIQRSFDRYSIKMFELYEYKPDEPNELFFRLNQGATLTPAEKRNTFYGSVRSTVREIVCHMQDRGYSATTIGFSNSRLSYHDVVARLIYALDMGVSKKITDKMLIELFRNGSVDDGVKRDLKIAIEILAESFFMKLKLNKSTLFTWLYFYAVELDNVEIFKSKDIIDSFYRCIRIVKSNPEQFDSMTIFFLDMYIEKSSSSVNDAIPVQIRLLSVYFYCITQNIKFHNSERYEIAYLIFDKLKNAKSFTEESLLKFIGDNKWSSVA